MKILIMKFKYVLIIKVVHYTKFLTIKPGYLTCVLHHQTFPILFITLNILSVIMIPFRQWVVVQNDTPTHVTLQPLHTWGTGLGRISV